MSGIPQVDTLGVPSAAKVQATSGAPQDIVLSPNCQRFSMYSTQGAWYSISGVATNQSHYIAANERLDFQVPENTTISVLQEFAAGSIRITELS